MIHDVHDRRNCTIVVCSSGVHAPTDVVIKITPRELATTIEIAETGMHRYGELFARSGWSDLRAPQPLGHTTEPPALVMEYVPGSDLHRELWRATPADVPRLSEAMARSGRALAVIHGEPVHVADGSLMVSSIRRRLGLSRGWAARAVDLVVPVVSAEDYAPNNIRVQESGIVVLDPPLSVRHVTAHEDIAHFAVQVAHHLAIGTHGKSADLRRVLVDAFLEGYAASGTFDPTAGAHRDLVRWFCVDKAAMWAVKYARRRDLRHAVFYSWRAGTGRVGLSRSIRGAAFV